MKKNKNININHETLSKYEKEIISECNLILKTNIEMIEKTSRDFINDGSLAFLSELDSLVIYFFEDYDKFYNNFININRFDNLLNSINEYLEYENLLRGFEFFPKVLFDKRKNSIINILKNGLMEELNSTMDVITSSLDSNTKIKHKEEVFSKLNERFKRMINKELNSNIEKITFEFFDIQDAITINIKEEVNSRINNIDLINEKVKSIKQDNITTFKIYESKNQIQLTIQDTTFTSEQSVRVDTVSKIDYNKTINSLNKTIENSILSKVSNLSNLNTIDKSFLLDDGRRISIKNATLKIDSSNIINKSYSYKELGQLAIDIGYQKSRYNGDHLIFVKNGKHIVIPQRPIGRGLQLKILKDLNVI